MGTDVNGLWVTPEGHVYTSQARGDLGQHGVLIKDGVVLNTYDSRNQLTQHHEHVQREHQFNDFEQLHSSPQCK